MTINNTIENKTMNIKVTDRLDTLTAPELEKAIFGELDLIENLVLDFKNLDYISSAGLRVILTAHKAVARKGKMIIRNANETVSDIFEATGFCNILTVE